MRSLVDTALALDPRIKRIKQEEKDAREAKKKARSGTATPVPTKAAQEEAKKKAEEEVKRKEEEDKVCNLLPRDVGCGVGVGVSVTSANAIAVYRRRERRRRRRRQPRRTQGKRRDARSVLGSEVHDGYPNTCTYSAIHTFSVELLRLGPRSVFPERDQCGWHS